ncbi:bifunctional 3-(3-hydroxy-phenyl)propionate/3-hydroxycinnamic acid hydroxylase [Streptomyces puniciscabiei]
MLVQRCDVAVVGYGPVAQTLSALLGQSGYQVAAFEKQPGIACSPRAIHIDDEIMRLMERIGAGADIRKDSMCWDTYDTRTTAFGGELLRHFDWSGIGRHGWREHWSFYQPRLEAAIDRRVRECSSVTVRFDSEAVALEQDADGVTLTVADTVTGERRTVRARHLVGADGADGFVRDALGITVSRGTGGPRRLVLDVEEKHPMSFEFENGHFLDPERPGCLFRLGTSHRRFEFQLFDHEQPEDFTTEKVWELLSPWGGPEDFHLLRRPVVTFRELMADTWQRGRCFLVGDAAHAMWPFAGQGMCSGMRDAAALAWRLDLLYRGAADASVLDTFTADRKDDVKSCMDQARQVGLPCIVLDPEQIEQRNALMRAQLADPSLRPVPPRRPGPRAFAHQDPTAGRPAIQAEVRRGGRQGLFDEVVGHGFVLLTGSAEAAAPTSLTPELRAALDRAGVIPAHVGPPGSAAPITDVTGAYGDWLTELGADCVLIRPDFYVYGSARGARAGLELLEHFARALRPDHLQGNP